MPVAAWQSIPQNSPLESGGKRVALAGNALQALSRKSDADFIALQRLLRALTLENLAAVLQAAPDSLVLAGARMSAVGLPSTCATFRPSSTQTGSWSCGKYDASAAGYTSCRGDPDRKLAALVAEVSATCGLAKRFASPPVCTSGTLGGNIATARHWGLHARPDRARCAAPLAPGSTRSDMPLESFYLGYQKKDLLPGEFVVG